MLKQLWILFRKLDIFLDKHALSLGVVLVVLLLRLPSIAEPYWYGDEAIYLTIGNALRAGERLYVDIIDHKTPLIYYFAAFAGSQFGFRLLTIGVVALTSAGFYWLTRDLFRRPLQQILAVLIFVAYTNLPRFEGNIPNGELFVLMFVVFALLVLKKTKFYQAFFQPDDTKNARITLYKDTSNTLLLLGSGVLFGLATLTKVPAVFDLAIVFVMGWFIIIDTVTHTKTPKSQQHKKISAALLQLGLIVTGWIVAICASIAYYTVRGSLEEYIDFGLFYNFRYAGSWTPQFASPTIAFFFTLKGKVLFLTGWILVLTGLRKKLTRRFVFASSWLALSLVAATLSNRPYPHYFLQVFPAMAIIVTDLLTTLLLVSRKAYQMYRSSKWVWSQTISHALMQVTLTTILIVCFMTTLRLLHVVPYPTRKYYSLFFQLITKQITWTEYRDQFNPLLKDNYQVAKMIKMCNEDEVFIWGDNPLLYALTGKNPTGRFIVAFHVDDFKAHHETLEAVKQKEPTYVIVMKDKAALPGLDEYLAAHYIPNTTEYSTFTVWRKINP